MAKFPHAREHSVGRSVLGDFMDDDLNERLYDTLIAASNNVQEALDMLRDFDDAQSAFDMGQLSAAQQVIESSIDEDYPPLVALHEARTQERMTWAITKSLGTGTTPK